jgi:hypothetical protein
MLVALSGSAVAQAPSQGADRQYPALWVPLLKNLTKAQVDRMQASANEFCRGLDYDAVRDMYNDVGACTLMQATAIQTVDSALSDLDYDPPTKYRWSRESWRPRPSHVFPQHHGEHATRDAGVGGILGAPLESLVVIVDREIDPSVVNRELAAFAQRVAVGESMAAQLLQEVCLRDRLRGEAVGRQGAEAGPGHGDARGPVEALAASVVQAADRFAAGCGDGIDHVDVLSPRE